MRTCGRKKAEPFPAQPSPLAFFSLPSCGETPYRTVRISPGRSDRNQRRARRPSGVPQLKAGEGDRLEAHCGDMTTWVVAGGASPWASLSMWTLWMTLPSLVPWTALFLVSLAW